MQFDKIIFLALCAQWTVKTAKSRLIFQIWVIQIMTKENDFLAGCAKLEAIAAAIEDPNFNARSFNSSLFQDIPQMQREEDAGQFLLKNMTNDDLLRRECAQFFEESAFNAFFALAYESRHFFNRSIDKKTFLKREINNVNFLLENGVNNLVNKKEFFYCKFIPEYYEKYVYGTWGEFLIYEELAEYIIENDIGDDYNSLPQDLKNSLPEMILDTVPEINRENNHGARYIDYFNPQWVVTKDIQGLIWYKEFLENILVSDGLVYELPSDGVKSEINESQYSLVECDSKREGDEHAQAMSESLKGFKLKYNRSPSFDELVSHMTENPPPGYIISVLKKQTKTISVTVNDTEKSIPLLKLQFKRRFERIPKI